MNTLKYKNFIGGAEGKMSEKVTKSLISAGIGKFLLTLLILL